MPVIAWVHLMQGQQKGLFGIMYKQNDLKIIA